MTLYFQNSQGKLKAVAQIDDNKSVEDCRAEVFKAIHKYCDDRNFKIYYIRIWNTELDGKQMTKFDVGSHTEFFFTDPVCAP